MELQMLNGETWRDFMGQDKVFLMLGKSDCAACNAWTTELEQHLGEGFEASGFKFGKLLLDQKGLTDFKREQGSWLKDVHDLPWNLLIVGGEHKKTWAGGGFDRLTTRIGNLKV